MSAIEPTIQNYRAFQAAYNHFNDYLFSGDLPECLITLQRKNKTLGYFCAERFQERSNTANAIPEIAMNPVHFKIRTETETLSTLVYEMVHLWQATSGKKCPKTAYHNKEWADKMEELGLMPTSTGGEGGKKTGVHMTHYIIRGGRFDTRCKSLLQGGFTLPYFEAPRDEAKAKKKSESKTKYTCPSCALNIWAKPDVRVICYACEAELEVA